MPLVAVVVPVKNEAPNVLPLIAEIESALTGRFAFEIVYVDDGSTDQTPTVLTQALAAHPTLRVFRHRTSCGQSQAIATGVRMARAGLIATLDGDGQNDPADIPALIEQWQSAEPSVQSGLMIAGWRTKRKDTWARRLASRFANGLRARALGDNTPDTGCGTKLFPRDLFLDLPRFDHMHRYLPALVLRAGGTVRSVPVNHRPRREGHSNYGNLGRALVGLPDLLGVMWLMRRSRNPHVESLKQ